MSKAEVICYIVQAVALGFCLGLQVAKMIYRK